ncbi:hypothetical protein PHLCEN_2v2440 [Hermanssonia centrifuga]|uniref:RNA polymerase-associated protein LEO1 n=1 Tax=Hermanssonia centrifuga TaxID=98765 RepID=A0A2R6RLW9_9APHY|nr:hypothetical protein PHLCEN_2v2440 [Hermanssonia centrifuga]
MSSLAGALDETLATVPKAEDVVHDLSLAAQLEDDVEMDVKPRSENGQDADDSAPAQDEDMEDLFGEDDVADDVKHEDALTPASSEHADGISSPERRHREAMEYPEDDEPETNSEVVQLEATAEIPNIPVPRSSDGNHWVIRIPNFIKVDSKPFHPDTYIGPEQEDEDIHPGESLREKSMSIKLKVENTVRWRWSRDGSVQDRRQSNSRVIRWSDGSLSLKLGKELFDITQSIDNSAAVPRQAIGGPSQSSQGTLSGAKPQGLTYLVAQHKRAEILQCETTITGYMSLRPTGMQSDTHRMLVRAVGQKHSKVARLRMAPDPTTDPEREKLELMKLASKKPRKARGEDDGLGGGRRKRTGYSRKRSGDDMWSDDEDEEIFGGGSEDEYGHAGAPGRNAKRRKAGEEDNKKRGPGEYQNDDFVVADSDEDGDFADSDEGEGRKKKTRTKRHEEPEEDDLDKLDAKIEAEQRKRRQQEATEQTGGDAKITGVEAMEVESEEDEGEWGVRRAGTGPRKRRALGLDEEEEE